MGDDIGYWNVGAYHQGMMAGRTPNLDKLAAEGMRFTDYYAEASCTAGRAAFITGELPIRTGRLRSWDLSWRWGWLLCHQRGQ
jgi:arylsulfatase A-like enzyme